MYYNHVSCVYSYLSTDHKLHIILYIDIHNYIASSCISADCSNM